MTNTEKREWILHQIACALVAFDLHEENEPESHITIVCPWGSKFKVGFTPERLTRFREKVSRCYGFRDHRAPCKSSRKIKPITYSDFLNKYNSDPEVTIC